MTKIFRVKGWFKHDNRHQAFTKETRALSEKHVLEQVYSEIGSRHKVKRNLIHVSEITEIKPEEAKDPRIIALSR
jgi:large subunit ribosomal protein LX